MDSRRVRSGFSRHDVRDYLCPHFGERAVFPESARHAIPHGPRMDAAIRTAPLWSTALNLRHAAGDGGRRDLHAADGFALGDLSFRVRLAARPRDSQTDSGNSGGSSNRSLWLLRADIHHAVDTD